MNVQLTAQRAYAQNSAPVRTPRGIEYDAFARITHRLKSASEAGQIAPLATALHDNRRLWTLLATQVAEAENELSADLRARIFYLAEFTNQHSRKVLRGQASPIALIDINTAIMRGLRQQEGGK